MFIEVNTRTYLAKELTPYLQATFGTTDDADSWKSSTVSEPEKTFMRGKIRVSEIEQYYEAKSIELLSSDPHSDIFDSTEITLLSGAVIVVDNSYEEIDERISNALGMAKG